jgi:hypothetical protein
VWACYPTYGKTACDKALVWNWVDNTIGVRDLPDATYAASGLLDYTLADTYNAQTLSYDEVAKAYNQNDYTPADLRLLMCGTTPGIYLADTGTKYGSTAISWMLERTGLAFDDPDTVKTVRSITPRAQAASGTQFYVQLGGSLDAEVAPTWGDPILYTAGSTLKAYGFATGRYLAYRLYGSQAQPVAFKSIDVDLVGRGKY